MKKINLLVLAVASSMLFSCSKDSDNAAVQNGLCTSATVNAFNEIAFSAQRITKYSTEADLIKVQNSCDSYKSLIAGNSCKLELAGKETTVNRNSRDTVCNPVAEALAQIKSETQARNNPVVQPTPVVAVPVAKEDQQLLLAVKDKMEFTVSKGKQVVPGEMSKPNLFQGGKTYSYSNISTLDRSNAFCTLLTMSEKYEESAQFEFNTFEVSKDNHFITISNSADGADLVQLVCFPASRHTADELIINDVKKAFSGLLEIKLLKAEKE